MNLGKVEFKKEKVGVWWIGLGIRETISFGW